MEKKILLITIALAELLSFACNKNDSDSQRALLTANGWIVVNFESRKVNGSVVEEWINKSSTRDNCVKDNITLFKPDGSYQENDGDIKCGANRSDIFAVGNWSFVSDGKQLRVTADYCNCGPQTLIYDILKLDKNRLELKVKGSDLSYPINGGNNYPSYEELKLTYSH